jgi:hypothetical protein
MRFPYLTHRWTDRLTRKARMISRRVDVVGEPQTIQFCGERRKDKIGAGE